MDDTATATARQALLEAERCARREDWPQAATWAAIGQGWAMLGLAAAQGTAAELAMIAGQPRCPHPTDAVRLESRIEGSRVRQRHVCGECGEEVRR